MFTELRSINVEEPAFCICCSVGICGELTIDGGGGNGIAGIVNSTGALDLAINDGWSLSWWWWWPWWWWLIGNDFGRTFCRLESVVLDKRSLKASKLRKKNCLLNDCKQRNNKNYNKKKEQNLSMQSVFAVPYHAYQHFAQKQLKLMHELYFSMAHDVLPCQFVEIIYVMVWLEY